MLDIFISYRRSDSRGDAGRLRDRLADHFGHEHVFMDIDDIGAGEDFAQALQKALASCGALIVMIGPEWADARDDQGAPRLHDPGDFVRMEIRRALEKGTTVIPVLVGGASMPQPRELPDEISDLCRYQAVEITDQDFHEDVDRLIGALAEHVGFGWHRLKISRPLRRALLGVAGAVIVAGLYFGAVSFQAHREMAARVAEHRQAGDRLFSQGEYASAITEYALALEADPTDDGVQRALVSATTQRLLMDAFGPNASVDIGLRSDYQRFRPVSDSAIDDARRLVYGLRAMEPRLEDDAGLLLDEALILKTSGSRVLEAIPLLERAMQLSPGDPRVAAELGLLRATQLGEPQGVDLLRGASDAAPDQPLYRYYLGRALEDVHGCSTPAEPGPGTAEACAQALREYRTARELATSQEYWARKVLAASVSRAYAILHAFAARVREAPGDTLALSDEERMEEIELLLAIRPDRSARGWWDHPEIWLVSLYEARDDFEEASALMGEFMADRSLRSAPVEWLELYARALRETGQDPATLRELEEFIEGRRR